MSSLTNPFSYADLPNDVGRLIFESLAEMGMLSCALVSRRVQSWVERVIYRDIALTSRERGDLFYRTLMDAEVATFTKPKAFLASAVKSLFIKWGVQAYIIGPVLKACSGVTVLALYIPDTYSSPELWDVMISDRLCPTQLALPGSTLPVGYRDFLQPIFRNLTHLEVLWEDEESLDLEWGTLRSLHQLTHISVDIQFDPEDELVVEVAKDILAQCPVSIRVCIIWVIFDTYFDPESEEYPGILALHKGEVDPRVVVGYSAVDLTDDEEEKHLGIQDASVLIRYADVIAGWSKPSTAKVTIWSRAEERIKQRVRDRREEVKQADDEVQ